jgi:hypothetical protein
VVDDRAVLVPEVGRLVAAVEDRGTQLMAGRPDLGPVELTGAALVDIYRALAHLLLGSAGGVDDTVAPAGLLDGAHSTEDPARALGALHETVLELRPTVDHGRLRLTAGGSRRKAAGAYFTPAALVEHLLDQALEPALDEADHPSDVTVCDPACGPGLFMVRAARRIARRGVPLGKAVRQVHGADTDAAAVELARLCLGLEAPGVPAGNLHSADALLDDHWPPREFDVVVGNPPFLNQLERLTAHRPGVAARLNEQSRGALRPYTDVSAVFLQRAVGWVRPGGWIALVQPQSLLAARDAAGVRADVAATCSLESLWASDTPMFDASVLTCAPVLRRRPGNGAGQPGEQGAVRRYFGPGFAELAAWERPELTGGWSYLLAAGLGIPEVGLDVGSGALGDLADCTADFRDQYYGLRPYVHEAAACPDGAPLVTSGLIDPAECLWGRRPTRFLKQRWDAPVIARQVLDDPDLGAWARSRLVPKVLVGTQGRVVEAVADEAGEWLPSVPTLTVVPRHGRLWHVLAVLLAPPVAAHAAATYAGTALSMRAIKLSARQVAALPLPPEGACWDGAAEAVRVAQQEPSQRAARLAEAAGLMCQAYGAGRDVLDWWLDRADLARRERGT